MRSVLRNSVLIQCFFLLSLSGPLAAKSWEQAIVDVSAMSEQFWRIASDKGFDQPLGTAFNEVDVEMHLCAILGRMVGHAKAISHLEPEQPGPLASGREFAIAATSLANWVTAARFHLGLEANAKRRIWNLDCVGKHGIPGELYVAVDLGHNIIFDAERAAIMVQGDIITGFSDALAHAIHQYPDAQIVSLGSGGGAVYEAMRAGRLIRSAGLETEVINGCYSACPLVLAGGSVRSMWWPFNDLGLHEVSRFGVAVPQSSGVYRDIGLYLAEMGVDAVEVLSMMWAASPSEMFLVPEQVRCDTRLITNHQRGCLAY